MLCCSFCFWCLLSVGGLVCQKLLAKCWEKKLQCKLFYWPLGKTKTRSQWSVSVYFDLFVCMVSFVGVSLKNRRGVFTQIWRNCSLRLALLNHYKTFCTPLVLNDYTKQFWLCLSNFFKTINNLSTVHYCLSFFKLSNFYFFDVCRLFCSSWLVSFISPHTHMSRSLISWE